MLAVRDLTLRYGKRILFENVNVKFNEGNCYGLIGANGAGKSTFIKILSGEIEPTAGAVEITPGERMAVLKQDHFEFDESTALDTVIMGHKELFDCIKEKDALYAKPDFSDKDGMRVSELEEIFENLNGYSAESEAATMLKGLGIEEKNHNKLLKELDANDKVKVLLAQALFGDPHILLLDEPTNHLSLEAIVWLEEFLLKFKNTVIVVSHDRHFLNKVCTHIADIDYQKLQLYVGNYDFWYHTSQLALRQMKESNKKKEDKIKELQTFIQRFSSNASKSKQATSRKKLIEKISIDDIKPSSRKYPYVDFKPDREAGNKILRLENLTVEVDGEAQFQNLTFEVNKGDKIAFVGPNGLSKTALFETLAGNLKAKSGSFEFGETITLGYFPKDNTMFFNNDLNLVDWLRQYSKEKDENFIRGYLGRMLFSGEESLKKSSVLSGGEKVRCMLSKVMLSGSNFLILDEPTNHLDLESITSLNNGMIKFTGTMLFVSHDHEFIQTVANRIIEITPAGIIDKHITFDEYLENEDIKALREKMYGSAISLG